MFSICMKTETLNHAYQGEAPSLQPHWFSPDSWSLTEEPEL